MDSSAPTLTLVDLRERLRVVEPAALLVEPRFLRRVIRLDRHLAGLGLFPPHWKSYTIARERLFVFAERSPLDVPAMLELPETVILLVKPVDEDVIDAVGAEQTLHRYWRLLFHARVHIELAKRFRDQPASNELIERRRRQIGAVEFEEIRAVLLKDAFLFPQPTDLETYVEFAAVYLELRYFAERHLAPFFPATRDWDAIEQIISQDVPHAELYAATRLPGAPVRLERTSEPLEFSPGADAPVDGSDRTLRSRPRFWKLQNRAKRTQAMGNVVKAAILRTRAARLAPPHRGVEVRAQAVVDLRTLVERLKRVLELSEDEAKQWSLALQPLLEPAARGFWSAEARLLYDLQKVCVEQERGVLRFDAVEWCRSFGRGPSRRPLPLLREVLVTKHLRAADRRLTTARIDPTDRSRLAALLASAAQHVELRLRDRIRSTIVQILSEVGLVPKNVPERIARRKLVEELLDRIVELGFLNMGDLRDALSKNDLKLPDISGLMELWQGDPLLRADQKLAVALDGVYRPGATYLRWPQRLSSLAFGTSFGRFVTKYIALPFGGAYLALEGTRHVAAPLMGRHATVPSDSAASSIDTMTTPQPGWFFFAAVLLLGTFLLLVIHHTIFRSWCAYALGSCWRIARRLVIDLPGRLVRSKLVQRLLQSQLYAALRSYLLRPLLFTVLISLPAYVSGRPLKAHVEFELFLLTALFLNTAVGRYVDEWLTDFMIRAWHELTVRVLAAMFYWVMETFHRLMVGLERILYSVDEWLRFRTGDHPVAEAAKLLAGTCWFFVSYIIVFVFTLLLEPQINPIKHFPVVTVSHKLILPTGPIFVKQLAPYIGAAKANTLVWSTIWMIPGVFGFLVWELKENWRLYAANRSRTLTPAPIGPHGESLVQLLRPGFHSGTLPKLFARLRHATRKAERTGNWKPVQQKQATLGRIEVAISHFAERELCNLLNRTPLGAVFKVGKIHLATNRIQIELVHGEQSEHALWLGWEELAGTLTATVVRAGWMASLSASQGNTLATALSAFFQRSGADQVRGLVGQPFAPPMSWDDWVQYCSTSTGASTSDLSPASGFSALDVP